MKIFTYILIFLALAMVIFNVTQLDFNNLFSGESVVALIGIICALCAIFIVLIFKISKSIEDKLKN